MILRKFFLSLFVLACISQVQAKTFILCVGLSDYPGTSNDLRVSANDARTIHAIFTKNGSVQPLLLVNQSATIRNVCNRMKALFSQAKADDSVILYFSGHGVPGGLCCYDGFLYYNTVYKIMKQCKAKNKMIFVDACFAGKMRSTNRHDSTPKAENVMLFLSSRTNERSLESPYQNSLFTIYLERALRGGADTNLDKNITARELYNFVHHGVSNTSRGRQHPVMWGKFNENMSVIKW